MGITYRAFVDGLEALEVEGVAEAFTQGPPASMVSVNLPAMWVQLPGGAEKGLVFGGAGEDLTLRAELVVLVDAVAQSTQGENFDATVDMLDAVTAALQSDDAHTLATGSPTWTIRTATVPIGNIDYWAVVATVEVLA